MKRPRKTIKQMSDITKTILERAEFPLEQVQTKHLKYDMFDNSDVLQFKIELNENNMKYKNSEENNLYITLYENDIVDLDYIEMKEFIENEFAKQTNNYITKLEKQIKAIQNNVETLKRFSIKKDK